MSDTLDTATDAHLKKRKPLTIMATPSDLDDLRFIFETMAADPDSDGTRIARKMMRAIHACRRKHGFRWTHGANRAETHASPHLR